MDYSASYQPEIIYAFGFSSSSFGNSPIRQTSANQNNGEFLSDSLASKTILSSRTFSAPESVPISKNVPAISSTEWYTSSFLSYMDSVDESFDNLQLIYYPTVPPSPKSMDQHEVIGTPPASPQQQSRHVLQRAKAASVRRMLNTDCSIYCELLTATPTAVAVGFSMAVVSLPANFKIQFDCMNPTIGPYPYINNILDLQNAASGQSLLALSVSSGAAANSVLTYNGVEVFSFGPTFDSNYAVTFTTFTVEVNIDSISIVSSDNPSWVATAPISTVETTGVFYNLYLSNPSAPSAGGTVKNILISGKALKITLLIQFLIFLAYILNVFLRMCSIRRCQHRAH